MFQKLMLKSLESQICEQENENDSLCFSLAHVQDDAVEWHKAFSEFVRNINAYGAKMMVASIALTKEWVTGEYLSIHLSEDDWFSNSVDKKKRQL